MPCLARCRCSPCLRLLSSRVPCLQTGRLRRESVHSSLSPSIVNRGALHIASALSRVKRHALRGDREPSAAEVALYEACPIGVRGKAQRPRCRLCLNSPHSLCSLLHTADCTARAPTVSSIFALSQVNCVHPGISRVRRYLMSQGRDALPRRTLAYAQWSRLRPRLLRSLGSVQDPRAKRTKSENGPSYACP